MASGSLCFDRYGVAPFASLIRDEETYQDFDEVYLTQTCRFAKDLKYAETESPKPKNARWRRSSKEASLLREATRESHQYEGRITNLIENGKLFSDLAFPG